MKEVVVGRCGRGELPFRDRVLLAVIEILQCSTMHFQMLLLSCPSLPNSLKRGKIQGNHDGRDCGGGSGRSL